MTADHATDSGPPWSRLPLELRAVGEYLRARWRPPATANWPRGHGLPVLVLPGFGQSDASTELLRQVLLRQGFETQGWGLGRNLGLQKGMTGQLIHRIEALQDAHGETPALIGWSLGGVIARELARKIPRQVRQVISLGSPLAGPQATTIQPLFRLLNPGQPAASHDPKRYQPPPVPCCALYTRQDGIVAWQSACEPQTGDTQNIEVCGSHLGLGFNPAVWYALCHRLSPDTAQQPFSWRPEHGRHGKDIGKAWWD